MRLFYTFWSKGHSPHDTNHVFLDLFERSVRSVALANPKGQIIIHTDARGSSQLSPFIHAHADVRDVLGRYDTYDTTQWALVKVKALLDILEEEPEYLLHIDHDIVWGYSLDAVLAALDTQRVQIAYQFPEPRNWRGYTNFQKAMPELARQYLNYSSHPFNAGVVFWRKALLPQLRCIVEAYEREQDCSIPQGHLGLEQLMIPEIMARQYPIGSMFKLRRSLPALSAPQGADALPQQPTMTDTGGYIPGIGLYHFLGGIKNEPQLLQNIDRILGHLIYERNKHPSIPESAELWVFCKDFPNYQVSSCGQVRRVGNIEPLKATPNERGYLCVTLRIAGKMHRAKVHRQVAKMFCPNAAGLPEVNHEDGVKANNCASNLKWCTRSYNLLHSWRVLGRKHSDSTRAKMRAANEGHTNHGSLCLFVNGAPTTCRALAALCGRSKSGVASLISQGLTPEQILQLPKHKHRNHRK